MILSMIKLIFWNYKQSLISFPRYSINMENQDEREWVINSHCGAFKEGLLENSEELYIESWRQRCKYARNGSSHHKRQTNRINT